MGERFCRLESLKRKLLKSADFAQWGIYAEKNYI